MSENKFLNIGEVGFAVSGVYVSKLFEEVERLKLTETKSGYDLNCIGVFNNTTETFVYDHISMSKQPQIVVCAHRLNSKSRPFRNLVCYNFYQLLGDLTNYSLSIEASLKIRAVKFHFAINFYKFYMSGMFTIKN